MSVVAQSDWVIDVGPGAGEEGGRVVAEGTPLRVAVVAGSRTAPYLHESLETIALDQERIPAQRDSSR
jgi:excinuclease ABC subunit A